MRKCTEIPHVENSKGEIVESKFFKELLPYASSTTEAKEWYSLGTGERFREEHGSQIKTDENGEITLNSFRELSGINIDDAKVISNLNDRIKSGKYDYEEAITKLEEFNKSSDYSDRYMATINYDSKGKFYLEVVPRTEKNEILLHDQIQQKETHNGVLNMLRRRGISTKFIETDDKEGGRYSTKNAEKLVNGTSQLITINYTKKTTEGRKTEMVAEEAGHIAVGILGENPLVERLEGLLTDDVQKQILGDEYDIKILGLSSKREVAGYLVGKALAGGIGFKSRWERLGHRIADLARKIMSVFKDNGDLIRIELEAKKLADKIAYNFATENDGFVEDALKTPETFFSQDSSANVRVYRNVVNRLALGVTQLVAIRRHKLSNIMSKILTSVEHERTPIINQEGENTIADSTALDGIVTAVLKILDNFGPGKALDVVLKSVDTSDMSKFKDHMQKYGDKLAQVRIFHTQVQSIVDIINKAIELEVFKGDITNVEFKNEFGISHSYNLKKLVKDLDEMLSVVNKELSKKESLSWLKLIGAVYGKRYMKIPGSILWSKTVKDDKGNPVRDSKGNLVAGGWKNRFLRRSDPKIIDFNKECERLSSDISWFEKMLASMSNNSDLIGGIVDKCLKLQNKKADDNVNNIQRRLARLEMFAKSKGIKNTRYCIEYDENGVPTGNFLTDRKWGKWLKDVEAEKADLEFEFENGISKQVLNNLPVGERETVLKERREKRQKEFEKLTIQEKLTKKMKFLKDKMTDWHSLNSDYDKTTKKYLPKQKNKDGSSYKYDNTEEFNREVASDKNKRDVYNQLVELKKEFDDCLDPGAALNVRLPQFKGRFMQRVNNKKNMSTTKKVTQTWRGMIHDQFCVSELDGSEFGSELTYNTEEEYVYGDALALEREKVRRLTTYGINPLKDMTELSTDLYSSLLAYASMAYTYKAMREVVGMMSVGKHILANREVAGMKKEGEEGQQISNAFYRLDKYIDKQLFNIASPVNVLSINENKKYVLEKIVATLTNFGSKFFLGGNIIGGAVNTGTGINEMFKEALTNQFFSLKDLSWAVGFYMKDVLPNWGQGGQTFKTDMNSLLINHFNILGRNKQKYRSFGHDRSFGTRVYNALVNESLWFAYSSGDHFMNTVPFLALMHATKLYDGNGKVLKVSDIYERRSEKVGDSTLYSLGLKKYNTGKKDDKGNDILSDVYFTSKEGREDYSTIQSIIEKYSKKTPEELTKKEEDYLNKRKAKSIDALHVSNEDKIDRHSKDYSVETPERLIRTLKQDAEELIWSQKTESDLMDKAREISIRMHGIYNKQDMVAFQQSWYGKAVLSMRGYALGMIERRYGKHKFSFATGTDMEGSWNTSAKALAYSVSNLFKFLDPNLSKKQRAKERIKFIMNVLFPMGDKTTKLMMEHGFSESQAYNLRRTAADVALIFAWLGIHALAATGKPTGDPDDDDIPLGLLYYFSGRLEREQSAFSLIAPKTFYQEMDAVTTVAPSSLAALMTIGTTLYNMALTPFHDESDKDYYYQRNEGNPTWRLYNKYEGKAYNKAKRSIPFVRSVYPFFNPYKAYDNYLWGMQKATSNK